MSYADLDISGQKFGKLTAIKCVEKANYTSKWLCKCDCGNDKITRIDSLLSGRCRSCGCLNQNRKCKHGGAKNGKTERLYHVWQDMKNRCYNKNIKHFDRYGGRGITVCEEWLRDYGKFREWAINNGYDENANHGECTLDRINNNIGYSPENCRWVSMSIQDNNRSTNKYYEYSGESHTISDWCRKLGLNCRLVESRIERGWTFIEAITVEKNPCRKYEHNGELHSLPEWANILNIPYNTLYCRLYRGHTFEEAITM